MFTEFLDACAANPSTCRLARKNATGNDLKIAVERALEDLRYNPMQVGTSLPVEYSKVKGILFDQLKAPAMYPYIARTFDALLSGNMSAITQFWKTFASGSSGEGDEAFWGIRCGEKSIRASRLADLRPVAEQLHNASKNFGDTWTSIPFTCAQWKIRAKEVYQGNFQVRTRNPALITANTYDPITPLASARNLSAALEGSVLLENRYLGVSQIHTSHD